MKVILLPPVCLSILLPSSPPVADAQWVQTNGPFGGSVQCLAVSGTNLFAGTLGGGVYSSTNSGVSWTVASSGLTNMYESALAVSGTNLFAGTLGSGVFLSTNNGTSWTAASNGLTDSVVNGLAVFGTKIFAGTWGGAFLSTDDGKSWTAVDSGLTNLCVNCFAVIGTYLFAGTGTNLFEGGGGVFLSTDGAAHWTAANTDLTDVNGIPFTVYSLAVFGTNLLAGTLGGGVRVSTNNGTGWTAANTGLTLSFVKAFAVSGTNLFAGTIGVFLSTNDGKSWTAVNSGLTNTSVQALAVGDTFLYAGTESGVWRRPLAEMITSVDLSRSELPDEFRLMQNYPNPFNPSTTIKYELPKFSLARLSVYDILGREVSLLVNERRGAGVYEVTFNGSNLSSGVYFCRLQAGDFVATKRLLLLK